MAGRLDAAPMDPSTIDLVVEQGGVRQLIARHPVAAILILMFVIGWGFLIPAALLDIPLIPFPMLGAIFLGQFGTAVLVTWAAGGWPAVPGLLCPGFQWRR